jgi:hypothetical protein
MKMTGDLRKPRKRAAKRSQKDPTSMSVWYLFECEWSPLDGSNAAPAEVV